MLERLEEQIEKAVAGEDQASISTPENENSIRLLGAFRGVSEELVNFARQSGGLIGLACVRPGSDGGMAMHLIPHELYAGEVFFPPMLLDAALGLVAATITARLFQPFPVSRYLYYPSLVLIALTVIYTGLFSIFLIPG
jgi:Protein of unknown function (DUF1656).